jgi:hypothetical protein
MNQLKLLAERIDDSMSRLVIEAELAARLDEAQAVEN